MPSEPLRLRLLNDYHVVVAGLRAMLEPYSDRVLVVEEDVRSSADRPVDVTLYDTFGAPQANGDDISAVVSDPLAGATVVYSWNVQPRLVDSAIERGCRGYLDKRLPAGEIVAAIESIAAGATVVRPARQESSEPVEGDWPGRSAGLTVREAEVIALIAQGMTNADIAAQAYISMNSLKSYIRSAYRKMGVERRSQAVLWGVENRMTPREDFHPWG